MTHANNTSAALRRTRTAESFCTWSHFTTNACLPLVCIALCCLASGCASMKLPQAAAPDIKEKREARQQQAVLEFERRRTQAQIHAAVTRVSQGDLDGAETMLREVLQRNPRHLDARIVLADVFVARGDLDQAEHTFRALLKDYPEDAQVHFALGVLLESAGETAEAQQLLDVAARLNPHNPLYDISRPLPHSHTSAEAVSGTSPMHVKMRTADNGTDNPKLRYTSHRTPSDAAATPAAREHLTRAVQAFAADQKSDGLNLMRRAISAEPHNANMIIAVAVHLLRAEQPELSLQVLRLAPPEQRQSLPMLRTLGAAHLQKGEPDAAETALRQGLSLDNTDALSYFLLGQALSDRGQPEAAAEAFALARQLDPRFAE